MAGRDTPDPAADELDAQLAELLLGPASQSPLEDRETLQALALLRRRLGQDLIFVSRFEGGQRVIAAVQADEGPVVLRVGDSAPLEDSWCYSVARGHMPEFVLDAASWVARGVVPAVDLRIGTHISTPIRLEDGSVFGMLCAFSEGVTGSATPNDLWHLRLAAQWLGSRLARSARQSAH